MPVRPADSADRVSRSINPSALVNIAPSDEARPCATSTRASEICSYSFCWLISISALRLLSCAQRDAVSSSSWASHNCTGHAVSSTRYICWISICALLIAACSILFAPSASPRACRIRANRIYPTTSDCKKPPAFGLLDSLTHVHFSVC